MDKDRLIGKPVKPKKPSPKKGTEQEPVPEKDWEFVEAVGEPAKT